MAAQIENTAKPLLLDNAIPVTDGAVKETSNNSAVSLNNNISETTPTVNTQDGERNSIKEHEDEFSARKAAKGNDTHTPEQLRVMQEYEDAVDKQLVKYISDIHNSQSKWYYRISVITAYKNKALEELDDNISKQTLENELPDTSNVIVSETTPTVNNEERPAFTP